MNKTMISNRLFLSLLILFSLVINSAGQSKKTPIGTSRQAKIDNVISIKNRTLLVSLYGNPETDENVKTIVRDFWNFNSEVIFLQKDMIGSKIENNVTKYAILSVDLVNVFTNSLSFGPSNQFIRFSIKLGENYNKTKPVYYQDVISKVKDDKFILNKREIIFAIDFMQNHLVARSEGKNRMIFTFEVLENSGKLENKTLLVDKEFLHEKLTIEDFKNNYPYPFKIADVETIEKAQIERNKDFAFVELAPFGGAADVMMHYIVDCENGQIISFGEFFNGAFDKFSNWINIEHIKAYVKNSRLERKNK